MTPVPSFLQNWEFFFAQRMYGHKNQLFNQIYITLYQPNYFLHLLIIIYDIRYIRFRPHHGHLVVVSVHPVENVEELVEGVGAQVAKHHILQLFCLIVVENVMENENVNENVII